jgi:hypothetical protein
MSGKCSKYDSRDFPPGATRGTAALKSPKSGKIPEGCVLREYVVRARPRVGVGHDRAA